MIIYFDMDGVLVNLVDPWLEVLNNWTGLDISQEKVDAWGLENLYPLSREKAYEPLHQPGFWARLEPYFMASYTVNWAKDKGHKILIATTPFNSKNCCQEKIDWIKDHFPWMHRYDIVLTGRKDLLIGDMLIDDKPSNLKGFIGKKVLFDRPWNRDTYAPSIGAERAHNFSDLRDIIARY